MNGAVGTTLGILAVIVFIIVASLPSMRRDKRIRNGQQSIPQSNNDYAWQLRGRYGERAYSQYAAERRLRGYLAYPAVLTEELVIGRSQEECRLLWGDWEVDRYIAVYTLTHGCPP